MAELHQRPRVEAEVVLKLNEAELRALHALADYGAYVFKTDLAALVLALFLIAFLLAKMP